MIHMCVCVCAFVHFGLDSCDWVFVQEIEEERQKKSLLITKTKIGSMCLTHTQTHKNTNQNSVFMDMADESN